ncbi:MAG: hypothetical protein J6I76_09005 [Oribacterium sp.]|nr:hypothetical protein [Oribacterium sp.]
MKKRVLLVAGIVPMMIALSGCSSVKEYLGGKMLQRSGVLEDSNYVEYEQYLTDGLLDPNGYYVDESDETGDSSSSDVRVTFAENNNLKVQYYSDSLLRNTTDKSNCSVKKGDSIYATVNISDSIFSSMYEFSDFRIYEYDENGEKKESTLAMDKSGDAYVLQIPVNLETNSLSIEPIGVYKERTIKLDDYYTDDNEQSQPLSGTWVINDKSYTEDSVNISPVTSYIISYEYNSDEYFYLSSDPECYYSNNFDGIVIFKQREPDDETVDYSVELHKYISVTLVSDMDRSIKVNGEDQGTIEANSELPIHKLKYGDTVTIETNKEWSGLERNRELILTQTEPLSGGNYRYTFIVPEKDGEFTFNPNDYSYDYGKIRFKCFGQTVYTTQVLARGSKIYYEQESALTGYWLAGKDSEHYIVVGDEESTKAALNNIHFTPKVDVSVELPQPESGGAVEYWLNGSRVYGKSCSTYSGAVITMKLKPWEGWIPEYVGEITYNVGDSKSQTANANGTSIDQVFAEDEGHQPALSVTLEKTVGSSMEFTLDASGYKMDVESYAGGWKVTDIFDKNSKNYNIMDNSQIIVEDKKIGTDKPILFTMSNRAIQSGTAVRMVITFTDSNNKKTSETRYIDDLSNTLDPIDIYDSSSMGTSTVWYKAVDVTIGVVDINKYSAPTASTNTRLTVKNADTNETLTNGYLIENSQKVVVTITPVDGYYVTGKKVSNDVYSDTMKYSDYIKNIDGIISNHPASKYYVITLDKSDTFATYVYKLDGKEVSGTINAKDGQKLELTYEITDGQHKLKQAAGGFIGIGASYTKASKTIKISSDLDGTTVTKLTFGIETE